MKIRKGPALLLAAALLLCALCGCRGKSLGELAGKPAVVIRNDGSRAELIIGGLDCPLMDGDREVIDTVEEIAAKYCADHPHTVITTERFGSYEELIAALTDGRVDIARIDGGDQRQLVREGALLDFGPYLAGWEEYGTLTSAAKLCVHLMGTERAYLLPDRIEQQVLFFRSDWVDAYNEGRPEEEWVYTRTWPQLALAGTQLETGRVAIGGRSTLVDIFDSVLWSTVTTNRMAAECAAYFAYGQGEGANIFPSERAANAAEGFLQLMDNVLPECLEVQEYDAVSAFLDGKAAFAIGDRTDIPRVREAMPADCWEVTEYPKGWTNTSSYMPMSYTGWVISARCTDWDKAFHFLTFLSGVDSNTHYAKVCGIAPMHTEGVNLEAWFSESDLATEIEMLTQSGMYRPASQPRMYDAWDDWNVLAAGQIDRLLAGEIDQEELLRWMDGYWQAAYAAEGRLWDQ